MPKQLSARRAKAIREAVIKANSAGVMQDDTQVKDAYQVLGLAAYTIRGDGMCWYRSAAAGMGLALPPHEIEELYATFGLDAVRDQGQFPLERFLHALALGGRLLAGEVGEDGKGVDVAAETKNIAERYANLRSQAMVGTIFGVDIVNYEYARPGFNEFEYEQTKLQMMAFGAGFADQVDRNDYMAPEEPPKIGSVIPSVGARRRYPIVLQSNITAHHTSMLAGSVPEKFQATVEAAQQNPAAAIAKVQLNAKHLQQTAKHIAEHGRAQFYVNAWNAFYQQAQHVDLYEDSELATAELLGKLGHVDAPKVVDSVYAAAEFGGGGGAGEPAPAAKPEQQQQPQAAAADAAELEGMRTLLAQWKGYVASIAAHYGQFMKPGAQDQDMMKPFEQAIEDIEAALGQDGASMDTIRRAIEGSPVVSVPMWEHALNDPDNPEKDIIKAFKYIVNLHKNSADRFQAVSRDAAAGLEGGGGGAAAPAPAAKPKQQPQAAPAAEEREAQQQEEDEAAAAILAVQLAEEKARQDEQVAADAAMARRMAEGSDAAATPASAPAQPKRTQRTPQQIAARAKAKARRRRLEAQWRKEAQAQQKAAAAQRKAAKSAASPAADAAAGNQEVPQQAAAPAPVAKFVMPKNGEAAKQLAAKFYAQARLKGVLANGDLRSHDDRLWALSQPEKTNYLKFMRSLKFAYESVGKSVPEEVDQAYAAMEVDKNYAAYQKRLRAHQARQQRQQQGSGGGAPAAKSPEQEQLEGFIELMGTALNEMNRIADELDANVNPDHGFNKVAMLDMRDGKEAIDLKKAEEWLNQAAIELTALRAAAASSQQGLGGGGGGAADGLPQQPQVKQVATADDAMKNTWVQELANYAIDSRAQKDAKEEEAKAGKRNGARFIGKAKLKGPANMTVHKILGAVALLMVVFKNTPAGKQIGAGNHEGFINAFKEFLHEAGVEIPASVLPAQGSGILDNVCSGQYAAVFAEQISCPGVFAEKRSTLDRVFKTGTELKGIVGRAPNGMIPAAAREAIGLRPESPALGMR